MEHGSFRREGRSFLLGLIGALIVAILSILAGTRDPLNLLIRTLIALVVLWLLFEILQTATVRSHLPLVWVGFGSHRRLLAKESDEELAQRLDAIVTGITGLMATHLRNQPDFHAGGDIQEWQLQTDRQRRNESNTAARFFEQFGGEILNATEALKQRNVLTEEQYRSLVWTLQIAGHGMTHDLPRVAAELAAASRKRRGRD
ncbi:MAG: hypothetical protein M3082_16490 [Candidatus Dormibacteraeota bacterium]|nr:hypothetical protein [Candidatus Dormibacteraeota bacterium]